MEKTTKLDEQTLEATVNNLKPSRKIQTKARKVKSKITQDNLSVIPASIVIDLKLLLLSLHRN